jgi:hypothetical protein
MDVGEALQTWTQMGNTYASWDHKGAYWILFIKDGQVVGNIKTVAGGIWWEYPDELFKHQQEQHDLEGCEDPSNMCE